MRPAKVAFTSAWLVAFSAFAQPAAIVPYGIVNAASRMHPELPGGSLAPGMRIFIEGVRLSGAAVEIRQSGQTRPAVIVNSAHKRIEAVVPPGLTPGSAEVVVVRPDGVASSPKRVEVKPASFGIFTTNGRGFGSAVLGAPALGPFHPSDRVVLRGTGLGGQRNLTVFAGGVSVSATGRATDEPGVDEVSFALPDRVPRGCYVPVVVTVAPGIVSNTATIAITGGAEGNKCDAGAQWLPAPDPNDKDHGIVLLARSNIRALTPTGEAEFTYDEGLAAFMRTPRETMVTALHMLPPPGSCTAYTTVLHPSEVTARNLLVLLLESFGGLGLRAGAELSVKSGLKSTGISSVDASRGYYESPLGGIPPSRRTPGKPLFLEPGDYRITSPGGPDVGPWAVTVRMPASPAWTEEKVFPRVIDRRRPALVRWQAGADTGTVAVQAINIDPGNMATGVCLCVALPRQRSLTIPAYALANIPPTMDGETIPVSSLTVITMSATGGSRPFQATGLTNGMAAALALRWSSVQFVP